VPGTLLRILLLIAGYATCAWLGRLLVMYPEFLASFWPGSGVGLAALLMRPKKEWPGLLAGIFVGNLLVAGLTNVPALPNVGYALGNTVESLVCAWVVDRAIGSQDLLANLRNLVVGAFAVAVAGIPPTAFWGAFVAYKAFGAPYWSVWRFWWGGDLLGVLLFTPVIMSWGSTNWLRAAFLFRRRLPESIAMLASAAVVSNFVFSAQAGAEYLLPFPYATFPFLLWGALRLGMRGASLASLTVAVVAVWHTVNFRGPFAVTGATHAAQVLSAQAFLLVAVLSTLILAMVIEERERARRALQDGNDVLEERIQARTRELQDTNVQLRGEVVNRERAEREVKRTVANLARSNAELQQFAYVASHDLREPLRAVGGIVQLMEKNYKAQMDDKAREYLTHIVDGVARMQLMIDDLLEFSRVGARQHAPQVVETGKVLETVLANLSVVIQESGAVVTHQGLPQISCDVTQFTQLLQNLVGNAIKFHGESRPEVHVSAEAKDSEWVFSVRDNGIGIDPQYFDRIFTIFQRLHTRRAYPGSGIGLAICKKIVTLHGGKIWVESTAGKGSSFHFTYPRQLAPPPPAVSATPGQALNSGAG
jgi:signal transduction histidine kinase